MEWRPRLKIYKGSNGKNTFNPETFEGRSYNWWVYIAKIKGVVVFNDYNYSVTTRKHQSSGWYLLTNELGVREQDIVVVNQRDSLTRGISIDFQYETLFEAEFRLKQKGRTEAYYKTQRDIIERCKREIKTLRRLGGKTSVPVISMRNLIFANETNRLERARAEAQAYRAKRKQLLETHKPELNSTQNVEV